MSAEDQSELSHSPVPPPKKMEGNYTQINVLFPSNQVELPSAEKFKAFPPEAQKAILEAFQREQTERHSWLKSQQANEHALNMQSGRHYYRWRLSGTVCGTLIVIAALGFGSWLITHGASAAGVSLMLVAIGGMVGAAIWGSGTTNTPSEKDKPDSGSPEDSKSS